METATEKPPAKRPLPQRAKKTKKRKHTDPAVLALRTVVQESCKINDLATAWDAYMKAIKVGTSVESTVFYCLMSLCDGLEDRGIHVGTPSTASSRTNRPDMKPSSTVPESKRQEYAETVLSHMQQVELPLTESVYTALVRLHSRAGSVDRAADLLTKAEATQQCEVKLRLYTPILVAYATNGNILKAVRLWKRLVDQGLRITERELRVLLEHSKSRALTQRILSELAEDIPVLSRATIGTIETIFQQNLKGYASSEDETATMVDILSKILPIPPAAVLDLTTKTQKEWLVSPSCQIDPVNGKLTSGCLEGLFLQPVAVPENSFQEMMVMNDEAARTGRCNNQSVYQGGGKGPKKEVPPHQQQQRAQQWQSFLDTLDSAGPIDVVIDGANVGYSFQNFAGAPKHVSYGKIDAVISRFTKQKKRVLVFLHCRHFMKPLMPKYAEKYLEKWEGMLYQTPAGMNDDWFWFHAALLKSSLMVTNDEMRDHYFQMVSPKALTRWRERHQVRFTIRVDERDLELQYPNPYSRRIQAVGAGLAVPLPKRGDVNRFLDGAFVAGAEEPEEETYLCVCPKPVAEK